MQPYKGRVLVAGATGRTGAEIVKRLRHYGIDFRLFVRSAQKAITLFGADAAGILRVGSIQDKEEARAALKGIDAVICAVGSNPADPESPPPSAIDRDGVQQLAALAKEAGARQFTLISSLGATREDHPLNKYGRVLSMKLEGENTVRAHFNTPEYSHTILRPGGLLDTPPFQHQLVFATGDTISGSVSRGDLAEAAVHSLTESNAKNRTFELIQGEEKRQLSSSEYFPKPSV
ncbi:SDR family oxidoreductase [Chlorobium phaeovibrioides]|uniref:SDR family oxidoreductase n=1 Tax=Chlorobium phaeovibrioides TaxID=1094 RepID=A0A5M8IAK9_CHLPH|nr:SDR family oxidoreductase [Chlorobium phaeovibrioides]KAA6232488.1 SDR family oxidoreductase [Chlorobium phaeovibrioides]